MNEGVYLFILWEKARDKQDVILKDMGKNFRILKALDVEWSQENFSRNLSRFYGEKLPDFSHKERHCGRGKFLLLVIRDESPNMENRVTSKGTSLVNTRVFDLKAKYREWTGGGHKIHCSNSLAETRHDLAMFFGLEAKSIISQVKSDETIRSVKKDLVGFDGWDSFDQLFYVLNNTSKYVVLRNFEDFPTAYTLDAHNDIDFLSDSSYDLRSIVNGVPVFNKGYRVHDRFTVGGESVLADFRYVGDGYYETEWEKRILHSRELDARGFYKPNREMYFFSLAYHALVHKRSLGEDYRKRLLTQYDALSIGEIEDHDFDGDSILLLLTRFITENQYSFTEPHDRSVYFNKKVVGIRNITFKRLFITEIKDFLRPLKSPVRLTKDIILASREIVLRLLWRFK